MNAGATHWSEKPHKNTRDDRVVKAFKTAAKVAKKRPAFQEVIEAAEEVLKRHDNALAHAAMTDAEAQIMGTVPLPSAPAPAGPGAKCSGCGCAIPGPKVNPSGFCGIGECCHAGRAKPQPAPDLINHPPHYEAGGFEALPIVRALGFDFDEGSAFKYLFRHKRKGMPLDDLKKCRFFIEALIARYEGEGATP